MSHLVVGCGYLGSRVAQSWISDGKDVCALTRSSERADKLRSMGIRPLVADVSDARSLNDLPKFQTVLFSLGFDRTAGQNIEDVYVGGLANTLGTLSNSVSRFIYISSTGVYSQNGGELIDENSECRPQTSGGIACLKAEALLDEHSTGKVAVVLRLAGIYGPDRIPRMAQLQRSEPFPCRRDGFLNLIHVDDAVQAVLGAEQVETTGRFIVADGNPVVRGEFYDFLAEKLRTDVNYTEIDASSSRGQRASSSKRCDNRKMLEHLNVRLKYPSFREGLSAILDEMQSH